MNIRLKAELKKAFAVKEDAVSYSGIETEDALELSDQTKVSENRPEQ